MTNAKEQSGKVFFPNLDGWRFICFVAVFFFHSFATNYKYIKGSSLYRFVKGFFVGNGNLGVNFFFVLSGFLITYLLFAEKEKYRKISIRNFYIRRVLRIWPLFYFCVFFGFVIFPILKHALGQVPNETARPLYYLLFLNNFDFINRGIPDSSVLSVLWSVAIEEQFYLVWPILIALVPKTNIRLLFLLIIAGTFCFRLYHYNDPAILEHHTFSCISDMAVGGYFAYLAYYRPRFLEKLRNSSRIWWVTMYVAIIAIVFFRKTIFQGNMALIAADRLIISVLFALVILEQNYARRSWFKMSNNKFLSRWGVYTYGLYCLHMIGILITVTILQRVGLDKNVYEVIFLAGLISLAITLTMAYISYHVFEKRFLNLKEKFELIRTATTEET